MKNPKKQSFNILGLFCRIEKNGFIILLSKITLLKYPELKITWWNLLEYSGSSEQNQEIFLGYCFHQKLKKNYNVVGLLYLWVKISETWKLFEAWVKATFIENNYYDRLKFCISALVGLKSWWRPCDITSSSWTLWLYLVNYWGK